MEQVEVGRLRWLILTLVLLSCGSLAGCVPVVDIRVSSASAGEFEFSICEAASFSSVRVDSVVGQKNVTIWEVEGPQIDGPTRLNLGAVPKGWKTIHNFDGRLDPDATGIYFVAASQDTSWPARYSLDEIPVDGWLKNDGSATPNSCH